MPRNFWKGAIRESQQLWFRPGPWPSRTPRGGDSQDSAGDTSDAPERLELNL